MERSKGKTVLGTKTLFKRKIGKDGQIEKYKCRFVAQGFRQVKGLPNHESSSPTLTASSMRAVLATAAVNNWELRHIDVEQAYLQANIDEEINIELPEDYRAFPNAVGLLRKAIFGLVIMLIPKIHRQYQREGLRAVPRESMRVQENRRRRSRDCCCGIRRRHTAGEQNKEG